MINTENTTIRFPSLVKWCEQYNTQSNVRYVSTFEPISKVSANERKNKTPNTHHDFSFHRAKNTSNLNYNKSTIPFYTNIYRYCDRTREKSCDFLRDRALSSIILFILRCCILCVKIKYQCVHVQRCWAYARFLLCANWAKILLLVFHCFIHTKVTRQQLQQQQRYQASTRERKSAFIWK